MKFVHVIWTLLATISVNNTDGGKRKSRPLLEPRIYNGRTAAKGQFPYQVLVIIDNSALIMICGGSILSRDYILTAAHCVDKAEKTPELITVYAGTIYFLSGGIEKRVSRVTVHPAYADFNKDIAILKLNSSFKFNDVINYIPLAKANIPDSSPVIVSGWGRVNKTDTSSVLQYNTEYSMSRAQCVRRVYQLGDAMRCMKRPVGHGICHGDSGGPAAHKGELVGVSSYCLGDCGRGNLDVFTDVVATREWIIKNMK